MKQNIQALYRNSGNVGQSNKIGGKMQQRYSNYLT